MFLVFLIILIISRSNSYLLGFQNLNPDESQMISNAINLVNKNFNIVEIDSTTSGILNSVILIWPKIFNLDITYFSARLTAIFLISYIIYIIFKIIHLQTKNFKITTFIIAPVVIFFSLTKDPDFSHYSSELLSITLLLTSYWLILKNKDYSNLMLLIITSLLLGMVFISKIQFFPVASVIFLILTYELILRKKFDFLTICFFSFILPAILIALIFLINNNLKDFILNNFVFSYEFIKSSQSEKALIKATIDKNNIINSSLPTGFKDHLYFNLIFHCFYTYFLIFIFFVIKKLSLREKIFFFTKDNIYITLILLSIVTVILIPGRLHRHYLLALLPFVPIFLSQIIISLSKRNKKVFNNSAGYTFVILIFCILISGFFEKYKFYGKKYAYQNFDINNIYLKSPRIFDYLFEKGETKNLYIWGWMPQWYALSNMPSSAKETISEKQIELSKHRLYYRNRLINDLKKNKPHLIIDFVKDKSFRYNKPSQNINSFNSLKKIINNQYVKLKNYDSNCPDYYLSKLSYEKLQKKIIPYTIVKKDNLELRNLNDFSITEDACNDGVIFDKFSEDNIDLKLSKKNRVSKVMILASKKNLKNTELSLSIFLRDKKIKQKNFILNKYPFWTEINFNSFDEIDKIELDIFNLKRNNFGINEVKIFN